MKQLLLIISAFLMPFALIAQNDLGITQIKHPTGTVCRDSAATAKIVVTNLGTTTLFFSNSNPLLISLLISGSSVSSYQQAVQTGVLAPGESFTVSIPDVQIDSGSHVATASLTYADDGNSTNNSFTTEVSVINSVTMLPYSEPLNPMGINPPSFGPDITITGSDTSVYTWKMQMGSSPHHPMGFGPESDHTMAGTMMQEWGGYAMVSGSTENHTSYWTSLTSGCLNLRDRETSYPVEMYFYKYFYVQDSVNSGGDTFDLYIEVGTGDDFLPVDTFSFPQNSSPDWEQLHTLLPDYNAVGQLRFTVTHHTGLIDVALDDIMLRAGCPDLGIAQIIYPIDHTSEEFTILHFHDTFQIITAVTNDGIVTLPEFSLHYRMGFANMITESEEHYSLPIAPHDTLIITSNPMPFNMQIPDSLLPHLYDIKVTGISDCDNNQFNNHQRVICLTNVGVDNHQQTETMTCRQYPNPASHSASFYFTVPESGEALLEVYSSQGKRLFSRQIEAMQGDNNLSLNLSDLPSGLYFYKLTFQKQTITNKMVVVQ